MDTSNSAIISSSQLLNILPSSQSDKSSFDLNKFLINEGIQPRVGDCININSSQLQSIGLFDMASISDTQATSNYTYSATRGEKSQQSGHAVAITSTKVPKEYNNLKDRKVLNISKNKVNKIKPKPVTKNVDVQLVDKNFKKLPFSLIDYTCSVNTTRKTRCKRKLTCVIHSIEEKTKIKRSKPFRVLLKEFNENPKLYQISKQDSKMIDNEFKENTDPSLNSASKDSAKLGGRIIPKSVPIPKEFDSVDTTINSTINTTINNANNETTNTSGNEENYDNWFEFENQTISFLDELNNEKFSLELSHERPLSSFSNKHLTNVNDSIEGYNDEVASHILDYFEETPNINRIDSNKDSTSNYNTSDNNRSTAYHSESCSSITSTDSKSNFLPLLLINNRKASPTSKSSTPITLPPPKNITKLTRFSRRELDNNNFQLIDQLTEKLIYWSYLSEEDKLLEINENFKNKLEYQYTVLDNSAETFADF